jgi:hypothetical protein
MPSANPDRPPTPDESAHDARQCLAHAERGWGEAPADQGALLHAVIGIGHALLAVAGELEAIREHGIYRAGDGA